jgi:hypothetical protein
MDASFNLKSILRQRNNYFIYFLVSIRLDTMMLVIVCDPRRDKCAKHH